MADERELARPDWSGVDENVPASPEGIAAFEGRFLRLLARRTGLYTMGESTSVPKHVAADILRSVCFVLGIDAEHPEVPEQLLRVDLEDEFRRRLADIERKVELSGELWRDAVAALPPIRNTALEDTLASIGNFPRLYDFRSMAHEIPCSIDYPLCHPVPEELLGVEYINEYLRRLLVEFDFLQRFEPGACVRVLERSSPDYVDLLVNLYEPVATNAIGRAIIGKDPLPLLIAEEDRARISERLEPLSPTARGAVLRESALEACDALGVHDDRAHEYLLTLTPELLPRIEIGLAWGDLSNIFS